MAEENKELTQQELSEQNRIRREKLAQMQEAGKDPFQIVKYDVTHHSDEIRANFDAQAYHGEGILLQYSGQKRSDAVLCQQE